MSEESYDTIPVKEVSVKRSDVKILNVRVKEPVDVFHNKRVNLPGVTHIHDEVEKQKAT